MKTTCKTRSNVDLGDTIEGGGEEKEERRGSEVGREGRGRGSG